jgi:hypothetical protein
MRDRKHPNHVCRPARHCDLDPVKPSTDWIPLQVTPNLTKKIEAYLACDKPKIGWCLLCNSPIESEVDFIPETNTHNCPEGIRFHGGCNQP